MDLQELMYHLNYLDTELNNPKNANEITEDMEVENNPKNVNEIMEEMDNMKEMLKASKRFSRL